MTLLVGIAGIGLLGPGLAGWAQAAPVLAGQAPYAPAPLTPPAPTLLPPTERRRTGPSVRLALAVAAEAVQDSGAPPEELDTVFASSNGEGQVITSILEALHTPDGAISPTQFHNSVHNAAAGYWGIAVGSSRPSVSLGGYDGVFATGLLHAAAQVVAGGEKVLFVAHDVPLPPPLGALRPTSESFALALVLAPGGARRGALRIEPCELPAPAAPTLPPGLGTLHDGNPVARALPLLSALAAGRHGGMLLPMLDDASLSVTVLG
ncbi:beta-ketoacyl synthase chain length factor [Roseomonas eburnea]|uniref:Beta-ketoacyl synthase chain length factor n=1 Tax=Neoroseomonas eburnea TaxID=1346889 RepID=A0A9X9XG92_9PROT|nr:beta-ketoacyl synthase chain length factor [Neoroseomonas eburnea]MBR0682728.1 beta-ketoacyl synthase chain length factor [Neoroseomonas eburnea]